MELGLFYEVGEAVRGLMPPDFGVVRFRAHRYGVKLWFDSEAAPREHYEAQVIGATRVPDATVLAIEIGFHSEHSQAEDNDATLERLMRRERVWRKVLGADAVAGPFLGRADQWRRVSETWPDPDLSDDDLCMEVALRVTEYMSALEPLLRGAPAQPNGGDDDQVTTRFTTASPRCWAWRFPSSKRLSVLHDLAARYPGP